MFWRTATQIRRCLFFFLLRLFLFFDFLFLGLYLVPDIGDSYEKGNEIQNLEKAGAVDDTVVFHAGTAVADGGVVTAGGRVLGITSLGNDLPDALSKAYIAVETISFKDAFYRNDIAHRELKRLGLDVNNE